MDLSASGFSKEIFNSYASRTDWQMYWQMANCDGFKCPKADPGTGASVPPPATRTSSASGMPSGKFKLTQSDNGRKSQSFASPTLVEVSTSTCWMTTSSMM